MTAPTRARRFPDSDTSTIGAAVISGDATSPSEAPKTARPYVIRNSVDRRSRGRRADDINPLTGTRSVTQPNPEELLKLDSKLRAYVDNAVQTARAEAYQEGNQDGRREALAGSGTIAAAVEAASAAVIEFSKDERNLATTTVVELAKRMATEVLNRTPHDGGAAVLERIQEVLEDLDDEPFTIAVHPDDLDVISAGVNGAAATIAVDPRLQPGEAQIRGAWSYSDLTRDATWEAIDNALS